MKWNRYGQQVEDNDPDGIYDEEPSNPEPLPAPIDDAPPDQASVLAAYQQQLLQSANKAAELERQLEEARRTPTAPPAPVDERAFFDSPRATTTEIVRQEIATAVAPINEFLNQAKRQTLYDNLKSQMKASGNFPHLETVESLFDQAMNGVVPTVQSMTYAYNTALGFYVSSGGEINRQSTPSNPPPKNPVAPLPPHSRSAPPPAPRKGGNAKVRELTAQEDIIRRHNRQSIKQYLYWTEHATGKDAAKITAEVEAAEIKRIFGE